MEHTPGQASYRMVSGKDPLGRLVDDLQRMVELGEAFKDEDLAAMAGHLLRHAQAAMDLHALVTNELAAVTARADGELFITEAEMEATSGLKFAHQPEGGGYRLTVNPMDDSHDQA